MENHLITLKNNVYPIRQAAHTVIGTV